MTALSPAVFAAQEEVRPLETTTAYELLVLESSVRQVPQGAEQLLHSAINDATTAALQTRSPLKTREEALAVLEAIQLALVKYNFLQPPEEKDWPQTLGDALKPRTFAPEALKAILSYSRNVRRAKYIDQTKPFYFVDCDMGAQLFLAVGERLGWDIRLVEIPQHNFVRWHLSESLKINWDWTRWESVDDSVYFAEIPTPEDHRLRALYLRSFEPKEARAYYLGLIGSEASLPSDGERLLQEAVKVLPNHPLTLNNLAWLYATNPEFAKHKSDLAVAYSLAAWSMRHNYGNFADTVACAFAADGASQLAGKIEEFAMEHPNNPAQRETFRKNRDRIMKGMLCNP
jgi:hypothetical protein